MTKKQAEIVFDIAITRFGYGITDPQESQERYEACVAFGKLIDSSGFGEDSELLDRLDSLGDIGMIAIDGDLEGMDVKIVWNKFGVSDVPANVRDAIRAVRSID